MTLNLFCFKLKIEIRAWYYGILSFFLIFAFPVLPFLSSAKIVMAFVLLELLFHQNINGRLELFADRLRNFLKLYYLLFFITVGETVINFAFDMSLTFRVLSSSFLYIVSFLFYSDAAKHLNISKVVIYCFVVQSIFILLAIFSESFYSLTAPLRKDMSLEHEMAFGRLRGNAISGQQFFGISSMYTFVVIYLMLHLKDFKHSIIFLILLFFASICSGRFSIVGFGIGLGMFCWRETLRRKIGKIIGVCTVAFAIFIGLIALLYNNVEAITDPIMYNVVEHYLIDPIDSVLEGGSFESSSTDRLAEMYEQEDIKQYFGLGAGRYTNPDGHYFGGVDIGYYRMLGYYGIIGFLFLTYVLYYLIYCTRSRLDIYTKHAFFINFLILNLKGDIQVFSNNIIPIIVAFLFFTSENENTL